MGRKIIGIGAIFKQDIRAAWRILTIVGLLIALSPPRGRASRGGGEGGTSQNRVSFRMAMG